MKAIELDFSKKEKLQLRLLELGRMPLDDLADELQSMDRPAMTELAEAYGMRVTERITRPGLIRMIATAAMRVARHQLT